MDQLEGRTVCPMCGAPVSSPNRKCATCGEALSTEPVRRAQSTFTTPLGNVLYLATFFIVIGVAVLLPLIAWLRRLLSG